MTVLVNVTYVYPQDLADEREEQRYRGVLSRILEEIRGIAADELSMQIIMSVQLIDSGNKTNHLSENYPDIVLVADVPCHEFDESEEIRIWLQKESVNRLEELEKEFDITINIFSWWRPFTCNFPNYN